MQEPIRRGQPVTLNHRARTVAAWALWLATMGCCAAGLVVALVVARPLTATVLLEGACSPSASRSGTRPSGWC